MSRTALGLAACALLLTITTASLADKTFNVSSGDWATAASWTPTGLPAITDTVFVNNGGTLGVSTSGAVCDTLRLENGGLNVTGGTLNAFQILAGVSNTGVVTHSAGTVTITSSLSLGSAAGMTGSYTLSGTGSLLPMDEYVGDVGTGAFTQNDATSVNTLGGWLYVGKSSTGAGTYAMNNGAFQAVDSYVGYGGSGAFTQAGGTSTLSDALQLGYLSTGSGTYNVNGGAFSSQDVIVGPSGNGTLNLNNTTGGFNVSRLLNFGANSHLSAASGSAIHMGNGSVQNSSTSASNLTGLQNVLTYFGATTGFPTTPSFLEVASQDEGAVSAGYTNNFALGGLSVGDGSNLGYVKLVDNSVNVTGGTADEALYVRNLIITAGSILDLNGLHLYYDTLTNLAGPSAIIDGTLTYDQAPALSNYLAADFNHDGKVSFADYLVLEASFGKSGMTNAQGDANNDGKVSFADYLVLESEFGHTSTPEPATLALLACGSLLALRRKSRA